MLVRIIKYASAITILIAMSLHVAGIITLCIRNSILQLCGSKYWQVGVMWGISVERESNIT